MLPIISWSFYKKMGDLVFIASVLVWLVIEESVEKFIEYLEDDE